MEVCIHPAAIEEARAAVEWYRERSSRAAEWFFADLDKMISRIARFPEQFPRGKFNTRRAVLHRFPYVVVFRPSHDFVEVIAVAHGRRKPSYWRERL